MHDPDADGQERYQTDGGYTIGDVSALAAISLTATSLLTTAECFAPNGFTCRITHRMPMAVFMVAIEHLHVDGVDLDSHIPVWTAVQHDRP